MEDLDGSHARGVDFQHARVRQLLLDELREEQVLLLQTDQVADVLRLVVAPVPLLDAADVLLQFALQQNEQVNFLQTVLQLIKL